jgi:hypothetical protein
MSTCCQSCSLAWSMPPRLLQLECFSCPSIERGPLREGSALHAECCQTAVPALRKRISNSSRPHTSSFAARKKQCHARKTMSCADPHDPAHAVAHALPGRAPVRRSSVDRSPKTTQAGVSTGTCCAPNVPCTLTVRARGRCELKPAASGTRERRYAARRVLIFRSCIVHLQQE